MQEREGGGRMSTVKFIVRGCLREDSSQKEGNENQIQEEEEKENNAEEKKKKEKGNNVEEKKRERKLCRGKRRK